MNLASEKEEGRGESQTE